MTVFNSKENTKVSHYGSRSPKYVELGHFTPLMFVVGRVRNVQRVRQNALTKTEFCLLNKPFVWRRSLGAAFMGPCLNLANLRIGEILCSEAYSFINCSSKFILSLSSLALLIKMKIIPCQWVHNLSHIFRK